MISLPRQKASTTVMTVPENADAKAVEVAETEVEIIAVVVAVAEEITEEGIIIIADEADKAPAGLAAGSLNFRL